MVAMASGLLQVATALAGLLVARSLSPAGYGQVAYFFSVFGTVVLVGSLGLTTQVTTEVARFVGRGEASAAPSVVTPLTVIRLATIVVLFGLCALVLALGDRITAIAGVAGGVALVAGFGLGAVQGLGRARVAVGLQLGQALAYLGVVVVWAKSTPERVFVTVIALYAVVAVAAVISSRALYARWSQAVRVVCTQWRNLIVPSGQVYLLTLLLAPFSMVAALFLGRSGRFADVASLSIALAFTLIPSTALAMVISVQYYPRLCQLVAGRTSNIHAYFDAFFRPFGAFSIIVAITLALNPREIVLLLYTSKYAASAAPLMAMAPCAGLLTVGQLTVWTLWAHGQVRWALGGALAQLAVLVAAVATAISLTHVSLLWLGAGHTVAAAAGLGVWAIGLKRLGAGYTWHARRVATAIALAVAAGSLVHRITIGVPTDRLTSAALLALVGMTISTVTVLVLLPDWFRQAYALVWKRRAVLT